MIAAHPDDETIGCGGRLPDWPGVLVIHVTDGSPLDPADALAAGCPDRAAYADLRRRELVAAMDLAGVPPDRLQAIDIPDGRASWRMAPLSRLLADRIEDAGIGTVVTHAYEGGHPDHDATAFAVHAAAALITCRGGSPPAIFEMTGYHMGAGGTLETGVFLPAEGVEETVFELAPERALLKRRMLDSFESQRRTLAPFGTGAERSRPAPPYDFTRPPAVPAWYDAFGRGTNSAQWRELVLAALDELASELGPDPGLGPRRCL